jgi:hypothetical protein
MDRKERYNIPGPREKSSRGIKSLLVESTERQREAHKTREEAA